MIARKYAGRLPWEAVIWGLGNLAVWLALWPLVFLGHHAALARLPHCHAQCHAILFAFPRSPARYYRAQGNQMALAERNRRSPLNHPAGIALSRRQGPPIFNIISTPTILTGTRITAAWRQDPGQRSGNRFRTGNPVPKAASTNMATSCGTSAGTICCSTAHCFQLAHFGILVALALSGHAIEAALLWWLPRHIGLTYIQFFPELGPPPSGR